MKFKIGLVANLDAEHSVHSHTFRRAVALTVQTGGRAAPQGVSWVLYDDHACAEGGLRAARAMCAEGVDVVVGHFASDSALAAGSVYADAGIPILLPAATADELLDRCATALRVCLPDRVLGASIALFLGRRLSDALAIKHDGSVHGQSLTRSLVDGWQALGGRRVSDERAADVLVYNGRFEASVAYVRTQRAAGFEGWIYLTDDALHPSLARRLGAAGSRCAVFGFAPASAWPGARELCKQYRERWAEEPGTYFVETIAALQIASQLSPEPTRLGALARLASGCFSTVMGPVRFDGRQSYTGKHALVHADGEPSLQPTLLPPITLQGSIQP